VARRLDLFAGSDDENKMFYSAVNQGYSTDSNKFSPRCVTATRAAIPSHCAANWHTYANPGTVNSAVPVPVKSTGVQLILVLPQDEKS
jgi:hypothetical protein